MGSKVIYSHRPFRIGVFLQSECEREFEAKVFLVQDIKSQNVLKNMRSRGEKRDSLFIALEPWDDSGRISRRITLRFAQKELEENFNVELYPSNDLKHIRLALKMKKGLKMLLRMATKDKRFANIAADDFFYRGIICLFDASTNKWHFKELPEEIGYRKRRLQEEKKRKGEEIDFTFFSF